MEGFLLRVHTVPDGSWEAESPYSWCITAVRLDAETVMLKGLYRDPTPDEIDAGEEALRREGFRWRAYWHKGKLHRKRL